MWVRSQDCKTLVDALCFTVADGFIHVDTPQLRATIGKYNSNERAMQVLDSMHCTIEEFGIRKDAIVKGERTTRNTVFQMLAK